MPVRLLVSDVDGTLVRDDKTLSDAVIAAVGRLQVAGVPTSLISARPPSGVRWLVSRLGLTTCYAAFNGGTIVGPDGATAFTARLAPATARRALELIDRPGITRWLFVEGRWHAERLDEVYTERERRAASQEPVVGRFALELNAVDKIVAVSPDAALLAEVEQAVRAAIGGEATVIRSQSYYLDITAPAANKGNGIELLARAAGVSLEDCVAIGDQRNDLAMFARAGMSIAMGQGPEEVRRAASRVARTNDQDGVAQAIDEIILPMVRRT
jgi:Cof subfamily protein (haloacid dehalogenase superfamily)